jgi:hypothetical protein
LSSYQNLPPRNSITHPALPGFLKWTICLLLGFIGILLLMSGNLLVVKASSTQANNNSVQPVNRQFPSGKGAASHRAVVNFAELANRERLTLPTRRPRAVHAPLEDEERNQNKSIPEGAFTPNDATHTTQSNIEPTIPSPALSANFLALDDNNTHIPPDTHGSAGPNHLMVALNSQVRIQTRTGTILSTISLNGFWATFGHGNVFDPRVYYDPYGSRWIFVALTDFRLASSSVLIGVSQTNDPTGNWSLYDIDFDATNTMFGDYPNVGFNKNWVTVTVNNYRISDKGFVNSKIYVFDKASLYAGNGSPFTLFQDATGTSQTPAVVYDNQHSTMYLLENWNGNSGGSGFLRLSTITGAVGSEVMNLGIAFPSTPNPWDNAPNSSDFAPQLGSTHKINIGDAVIQNMVYRNGSLWCVQTIFLPAGGAASRSSIQWWQLTPSGNIQQRGRLDDPTGNLFYGFPSLAVNQTNDLLIGYSRFSSSQYAGASYSFRAASDPLNVLRDRVTLKDGQAPYYKINTGTRNKWGDYNSTVVDALNDTDFWTLQAYAATPTGGVDRWGTWWGHISPTSPPPSTPSDIVLYASEAPVKIGNWQIVTDASAAGGARLFNSDAGAAKIPTASANPTNYFEMTFNAQASTAYHLWLRGKAFNDYWGNDSVFIQFSDSVNSTGSPTYRIGSTAATEFNLEDCSGCGLAGWGWQDNGWGVGVIGPNIYFQSSGLHTIRLQVREDGLSLDQIVLSPSTYLTSSPGSLKNDTTILPRGDNPPSPAPIITGVIPNSGSVNGGTSISINGNNFVSGASVKFGGAMATSVNVANNTTITATTPPHSAGTVNVEVINPDGQSATLAGGFTYLSSPPPETILLADDFNDNSLNTTKWIANSLYSGFTDATVQAIETNQRFEIGPLFTGASGSHYNGISSVSGFNFSGAYCFVELVQSPAANTTADAMLTIGLDANNYYRIYVEAGVLYLQKRVQGNKTVLSTRSYSTLNHRYLRLRHHNANGTVIFEAAADNSGQPGPWVELYNESWNTTNIPLTGVKFELKGGTWQSEGNAGGKVIFDNFKAARP